MTDVDQPGDLDGDGDRHAHGDRLRTYRLMPDRRRLPNRRNAVTETVAAGNMTLIASIGFDETGQPGEVFLAGAKDGSGMAAILDDASVIIS